MLLMSNIDNKNTAAPKPYLAILVAKISNLSWSGVFSSLVRSAIKVRPWKELGPMAVTI